MKQSNTLRTIGGLSTLAVAAGFAVALGGGTATAAPGSIAWADGKSNYVRTISNVTPAEGEIITISTQFKRSSEEEKVTAMKDVHPDCLTFVGLKIDGTPTALTNFEPTFARVVGTWYVNPNLSRTMEYSYKVGANCARNVALNTYMDYSGNLGAGNYLNKGPTISVTRNSTTVLATAPTDAKVGQAVPLSATVTGGVDGDIVEFYDSTTKLGESTLAAGTATFAWTPAATGARSLTAKFVGTAVTGPSASAAQNVSVAPADVVTTTTVTGPATSTAGADVTLNVQVSPIPSGGTVQFKDGDTNIGGPVTLDAQGKGSLTQQFATGTRNITAVYAGSAQFLTSTSVVHAVVVTPANVNTSITISGDTTGTVGGSGVTLNAHVTDGPAAGGGSVQFKDGDTLLGAALPVGPTGDVSLVTTELAVGTRTITAVYSGVGEYQGSTSSTHTVAMSPANVSTETTISGDTTGVVGTDVTLNVKVSPAPVGGTVQFKNGAANIGGLVTLDANGNGSINVPLAAGTHSITAEYTGAGKFQPSTSDARTITVTAPTAENVATTAAATVPTTAVTGTDVVLGVQVSPAPVGGTVQFKNGNSNIGDEITLDADGKGSITQKFTTTGPQSITAVYSGATGFLTSTSEAHIITVSAPTANDVATTTELNVPATATTGVAVDLVATISPTPAGGTVQFKDGNTLIGQPVALVNGKATLHHSFATTGDRHITAVYTGNPGAHLGSTAEAKTVVVTDAATGPGTGSLGSLGNIFGS